MDNYIRCQRQRLSRKLTLITMKKRSISSKTEFQTRGFKIKCSDSNRFKSCSIWGESDTLKDFYFRKTGCIRKKLKGHFRPFLKEKC